MVVVEEEEDGVEEEGVEEEEEGWLVNAVDLEKGGTSVLGILMSVCMYVHTVRILIEIDRHDSYS